jgi:hypothetical protein
VVAATLASDAVPLCHSEPLLDVYVANEVSPAGGDPTVTVTAESDAPSLTTTTVSCAVASFMNALASNAFDPPSFPPTTAATRCAPGRMYLKKCFAATHFGSF